MWVGSPRAVGQVVLLGGGTLLPGFADRLTSELTEALAEANTPTPVKVTARGDRRIACWLGGATLGATATGRATFVDRRAYESDRTVLHSPYNALAGRSIDEQEAAAEREEATAEDTRAAAVAALEAGGSVARS